MAIHSQVSFFMLVAVFGLVAVSDAGVIRREMRLEFDVGVLGAWTMGQLLEWYRSAVAEVRS